MILPGSAPTRLLGPRISLLLLVLIPLSVYAPTIAHEYAMRDDYAHLREAHEETGKLWRFHAGLGRPVYGLLMEGSFALLDAVPDLRYARLGSLALLIALSVLVRKRLMALGFPELEAWAVALGVLFLPSAQMMVAWAAQWGFALAPLLSLAGFSLVERGLALEKHARVAHVALELLMYALAAMTYQSHATLAVMLVAATLLTRRWSNAATAARFCATHLTLMFGGMFVSYVLVRLASVSGLYPMSPRTALERELSTKLAWFCQVPLRNALGLFALHDDARAGGTGFWLTAAIVFATLFSALLALRKRPWRERLYWLLAIMVLPLCAQGVSLAAAERSAAYRTQFALSCLSLVCVGAAYGRLRVRMSHSRVLRQLLPAGLIVLMGFAALTAGRQAYALVAEPQGREWRHMRDAVMRAPLGRPTRVYAVEPAPEERLVDTHYYDEFGTLSAASDWVPREMFVQALHVRFPRGVPAPYSFTFTQARAVPSRGAYDYVIDMRLGRRLTPRAAW